MNDILKNINRKGWLLLFSWQLPNANMYMVFRRVKMPEFVVSVSGDSESRMLGKAEKMIAWMENFISENDLESKMNDFLERQNESIKYIKDKIRKYDENAMSNK